MIELIVIENSVVSIAKREMRRAKFTETGGALVGHLEGHHLVITSASGPGPRAELRMRSVLIDGEHATRFCARVRSQTDGADDYVGDWHCHLGYSLEPSELDYDAMKTMATFESATNVNPVSVIWSKWSGKLRAYYFDDARVLREIRVVRPA